MTKNYDGETSKNQEEKMSQSNVRTPQDDVMDFIETLGNHLEDAFSAASSQTEKGETSATGADRNAPDPPDYWEDNKSEGAEKSADGSDNNNEHHRRHHRGGPWGHGGRGGCRRDGGNPWGRDWRQAAEQWFPQGFPFPGGRGGRGFGRGGFGPGFGGHGGPPQFGGPWGWNHHNRWNHHERNNNEGMDQQFTPAVDLFDTPDNYTVHVALPGALKEDIGINYDFETSNLQISGVVHRPGNEEFLKYLVSGERSVGAFDTKVKLKGYDQNGQAITVDTDAITAKLENGVLEVVVSKIKRDEPEKKKKILIQ